MGEHSKKPKKQKKPPILPQKPRALKEPGLLYTIARALLPLTQLEPTPLASRFIEQSRFLTSLFPFYLGAETKCCSSSTKVKKSKNPLLIKKKSKKPFSLPLKETPIV
jgi:hypothetical protein